MAINISKYKRPDVFIEEIDNSIIDQIVTEGIINLVPGFSKKGQFNRPILLKKKSDALSIIGPIDRNLEKKGSYLHRTVYKMLESGPVYALNLLKTDDTLDVMEYQSVSTSSGTANDIERTESYRRFFNTSGFWERDTESFLNFATYNSLLHFTNMSDKKVTVFAVKSSQPGFNLTVADWYTGVPADQIPTFLRPTDLISDYMIRVVVVSGDWSDYTNLSVDPIWGNYFNASGLRKEELNNFVNHQGVTTLADYAALSLIPYFRDSNNNDIFVENVINRDTDRTGLFVAYNYDSIETDFPNAMVDLIGNSLVDSENTTIKYLSYEENISESLTYAQKQLDSAANVQGNAAVIVAARTYNFMDEFTSGITVTNAVAAAIPTIDVVGGVGNYYNYQGEQYSVPVATTTLTLAAIATPGVGNLNQRYDAIYLDNNGIQVATGIAQEAPAPTPVQPTVPATAIVLGYVFIEATDVPAYTNTYTAVTVNGAGFVNLVAGTDLSAPTLTDPNQIEFIFAGTSGTIPTNNYEAYRRVKYFNTLVSILDGPNKDKAVFITSTGDKTTLEGSTVTVDTSADKTIAVTLADTAADINTLYTASRRWTLYFVDDEFIVGSGVAASYAMVTKNSVATAAEGVIAKYSEMYTDYSNGVINTQDYFYEKLVEASSTLITPFEFKDVSGNDYIVMATTDYTTLTGGGYGNPGDKLFIVGGDSNNEQTFTITNVIAPSTVGITSATQTAFQVNENIVTETIAAGDTISVYAANEKIYLQFFLVNDVLNVNYANFDFTAEITLNNVATLNADIRLYSYRNNYKQTLEIEQPSGYTQTINKVLINASRYSEVKVGDYLKAYVDTGSLNPGEEPKRLTRIISKKAYQPDPTYVELTCDSQIDLVEFGTGDFQTTRYSTIEDYVLTYKALVLGGFQVRAASMPDGTEARQASILDIIAEGEPLAKALIDKNRIAWRYLIDSFGLGLQENSKQQYLDLCGERLNVFAFINMPSMKSFKDSTSPSFVDAEGNLVVEFIKEGADPASNPAFLYSFGTGVGQSTVGYFCPYMKINDNGRPINVPPAMFAATTYMRKHISRVAGLTPWTIAAGITDGKIESITDVEYQFLPEDIEHLNEMGANPIVFKLGRGFNIETENTAQQTPKSALSYIHVREVLIELENELRNMLLNFQWKFNTPEIRAEIKLRADAICQRFVDRKGLFDFRNICDETNNTNTLIDNQLGVVDTYIEVVKGMAIIVNNINVLRTGAIQSGGFQTV